MKKKILFICFSLLISHLAWSQPRPIPNNCSAEIIPEYWIERDPHFHVTEQGYLFVFDDDGRQITNGIALGGSYEVDVVEDDQRIRITYEYTQNGNLIITVCPLK